MLSVGRTFLSEMNCLSALVTSCPCLGVCPDRSVQITRPQADTTLPDAVAL